MANEICSEWVKKEAREREGKKTMENKGIHKEHKGYKNKGRAAAHVR